MIVSGPNGSGKTTLAEQYAEQLGYPYLGADKIAAELETDDPATQRTTAGRRFSAILANTIESRQSVVVESTLSGRTFVQTMKHARSASFSVSLVHLFLDSPDTCIARVKERVQKGGHDVPELDVRRRFTRSAANFWSLYRPLCDRWLLMYNASAEAHPVAEGNPTTHSVKDSDLFNTFMEIVQAND